MANKGNGTMKRGAANTLKNSYTTNRSVNRILNSNNSANKAQTRQRAKKSK